MFYLGFSWSPKYRDTGETLKHLYASPGVYPAAVIMNMGLHDLDPYPVPEYLQQLM